MEKIFGVYGWTFLLSLMPISEIRGAMIYSLPQIDHTIWNMLSVYFLAVFANFLPVPFIMLLFRPLVKWLKKTKLFGKAAHWLENRTEKKASTLKAASAWALMIFVAIPFPTTGAWTGSMIASLLDMRFKYALPAILCGILISGLIMMLLMTGVLNLGSLGDIMTHQ